MPGAYVGRPIAAVIDEFRDSGYPFAYSTSLVPDNLLVLAEPSAGSPVDVVTQILAPHGLTVRTDSGVHLVVRQAAAPTSQDAPEPDPQNEPAREFENVVVSASRYAISRDVASTFSIDQRSIQNMPDIGEDPIRVAQRLPGTAASGASAAAHFRGGEQGEVGIMLNGQWLFDPFHIRDYQSIFSTIDARAIDGVEVFTGGFSVRYGDRMSGLVIMDSLESDKQRHSEIGVSVFNTSFLTVGNAKKSRWLFSARRGNLDLVIDPKFGRPSYFDVFAEYEYEISSRARLSFNTLFADDTVDLVLETDPDERDQVSSDTRNAQFWTRLDNDWSDSLSSMTVFSFTDYANRRTGFADDREKMVADVDDYREVTQVGFRQDWLWHGSERRRMQWGLNVRSSRANFVYAGDAEYFGLQAMYENQPTSVSRRVSARPKGASYAVYFSDRWKVNARTTLEWGLRWDDQTYTDLSSDAQLSPRLNVLVGLSDQTELRLSAGRYYQSQAIQSMQVEDGVDRYWPAQRADQVIVGLRHKLGDDTTLRVETFYKDFGKVRPRFENLFDPLGLMPELQPDRVRLEPTGAAARGVEVSMSGTTEGRTWWGSYTWSRVTDRINGADVLRSWDQTHAVQAGMEWRGDKWSFAAAASVHTGWPATDLVLSDQGIAMPGARNALRHETFASVDARLSRQFDVRRGSLLAFIEISNVFDRRNECCIDWDVTDDPMGNTILERGQDYWMPRLPAIGILWEF